MFAAGNSKSLLTRKSRFTLRALPVLLLFLLHLTSAKADTLDVISVSASFAPGSTNQVIDPTPNFYLTGDFTLDTTATSASITSFDLTLTPVGSASYQFSSGSTSALLCGYCGGNSSYWKFSFNDSNASVLLPTIYYDLPLAAGDTYYLGAGATTYAGGRFVLPWGDASGGVSFDGTSGFTYGEDLGSTLTSGYLYVDSSDAVPEPSAFSLLLMGVAGLLGISYLKSRFERPASQQ